MRFISVALAVLAVAPALSAQVVVGGRGGGRAAVAARLDGLRLVEPGIPGDRAVLGLQTSSGGAKDSLGILVSSVTPGGPADGAGIAEGSHLVGINGVILRLSPVDAGDPDMSGVLARRLQREMDKVTAGDVVELRVYADGRTRTVRVRTVRADQLQPTRTATRAVRVDDRSSLGASVGGSPSLRDTLGVFVVAVADDGPLARAGVFEGARIAAINGVDLRVPAADAGDQFMSGARVRRFQREVENLTPGANAELRVYVNGQSRTVTVRAVRRSELRDEHSITIFKSGGGSSFLFPGLDLNGLRYDLQHDLPDAIRRSLEEAHGATQKALERLRDGRTHHEFDGAAEARIRELVEERSRLLVEQRGSPTRSSPGSTPRIVRQPETGAVTQRPTARIARAATEAAAASQLASTIANTTRVNTGVSPALLTTAGPLTAGRSRVFSVAGVRLGPVDEQLASYLGAGSERGLLVLDVDSRWSGIHAGDVILSIDGRAVRDGDATRVGLDTSREHRIELLRGGRRLNEVVRRY